MRGMKIITTMTSENLNHYYTKNYDNLTDYSIKAIKHFRRKLDTTWVLSECYLYLVDNIYLLKNESDVQSFSKNWIKTNLRWKTTPIVRASQVNNNSEDILFFHSINNGPDSSDILSKIEDFRDTLNTYDRRLFNIWWDLDLRKIKEVAEYLQISSSGAYRIIGECKELDIRLEIFIRKNII